ncbi:hypothetical protein [Limosilactobacillus reuteri]|uniref:hypothetical protein n=1 Tax=Limosilactobacillus reuteri TaxID=1598 RepID=UPI001179E08A|nr:hypothetical protein [Limosilactobacillus reuteri]
MSEENDYSLLTKDEQKKLHEKVFGPITNINDCLKNLEDNKGKLLDTLEEIKLEGGVEKLIGLRNEVCNESAELNRLRWEILSAPFVDSIDHALLGQVSDRLNELINILDLLILADCSEVMSSGMVNLQINHTDFFVHALNKDGWIPDKVNDEDDTKITLSDLLKAERNRKKTNK